VFKNNQLQDTNTSLCTNEKQRERLHDMKSYQTAEAMSNSWWFLSGIASDSPTKKFDTMLVAKHINILETQHANGCRRDKAVEPAHNFMQTEDTKRR